MTTTANPIVHLNHAWAATNSVWGKICIVFFYIFIWLQILWALQIVISPRMGYECFYTDMSEYMERGTMSLLRGMNIYTIGFYLYANRGGIKVWNVAMVFLFNLFWTLSMLTMNSYSSMQGGPQDCDDVIHRSMVTLWVLVIWSAVALLTTYMESKTSAGSPRETAPLV